MLAGPAGTVILVMAGGLIGGLIGGGMAAVNKYRLIYIEEYVVVCYESVTVFN